MKDQTLICQNCCGEFLFTAGEQAFYAEKRLLKPNLCPICRSIKSQEKKIPPRPLSPKATKQSNP